MSEQAWRESAYLRKENWPEAIPWTGPKREYGPWSWGRPTHDQYGIDEYPYNHPDAASVGHYYAGDVCPMCGVPLALDEVVVNKAGETGELHEVSPDEGPVPSYHPDCYAERQAELGAKEHTTLDNYS